MRTATPTTHLPSLVVLPFVNTSAELDNEFFCDGLAEDLISALTKLAQLRVVARTSAFSFKGQNLDVREIGRRLNVGAVLEGSVRRVGNRLRITVQLVNVADGYDLWSERYDRQLTDIFDIQDEITLAIVEALKVKLLSGQQAVLLKRPTDNLEAWEWYQKARWHFGLFNPDSFSNAIECAQKAVEADPDFAQAWAFMSLLFSMLAVWGGGDQEDLLAQAMTAAKKALALDEQLGDSHCAMGVSLSCAFDLEAAEWHLRHAQELSPNDSTTRAFYANCALTPQGKFDDALAQFRLAHANDPLSMAISSSMGYAWYVARRYEEGLAHIWPLIEMAPTYATNYLEVGRCLAQLNRLDEALSVLEQSVKLSGGMSFDLATLGYVYGLAGKRNEAEQVLNQLTQRGFFAECALVCAGINDIDEAFRWLELSYTKRQAVLSLHLRVEPGYDRLRDDPRFADLVERVYGASYLVKGARSSAELFQQAEQLYYRVLELDVSGRSGFLSKACGEDEELRSEVESLLAAHDEAGSFIAGNAVEDHAEKLAAPKQASNEEQATAMLPNPLTDSAQRKINQYRILYLLGKGGMGEVWLAEDTKLKRKVALKLLPAEFTNDADRLRRFEQEALAISALNHPNIITIHEIGESEAGRFIVMELVAGRTLRAMAAESIPLDSLIAWGGQLAKALHVAHTAGITHRDIKPDNIMVRDDGYVKVLDFGLARLDASRENFGEADSLAGTKSGVLLGTVKYMSPEQARGERVTSATDIFALGILFYELATGTHPFNSATLLGTLQQITTETPRPPAQLNPSLPAAIDALIQRMLTKDASARPSAAQLEAALREIERQQNSGTTRSGALHPPTLPSVRRTVGRKPERLELRAAFNSVKSGRGSLLCVAGEPGIGKTTLVEDFLAELAAEQCTIARGRCSERLAGTEAYLPLLEALENLLAKKAPMLVGQVPNLPYNDKLKQLAPTWYAQVVPLSGDNEESSRLLAEVRAASQERMKRELANFLQAVAQSQPLVIFFDDLHWADVSTIDLLSFLAGKFDALNLLVVVTYRPSDMLLAKHPFLQIKPDLQARGVCRELLLEFLTEAEIAEYLALEFPGHCFPAEFPGLIHTKTEGSPLFMADLVRYLRDRSVIANTSGAWMLAQTLPDIERELPESVRGMIERKIAQLSEDDRKLLTCASVQGYEFDSAVVAQVLNLEADEVEERLEKLERVFAFVKLTSEAEFPNGTLTLKYRFVHVLYQNALYAGLRVTRKATLSRDVALALEACYGARSASVANELALLWEAARDYARAADSFLQAAEHSSQVFAVQEAVDLARRGLAMIEKLPDDAARQTKELPLQILLANALIATQGYSAPEVEQAYLRGHKLCQSLGDAADPLPILGGLSLFRSMRGQFQAGREMAQEFLEIASRQHDPAELFGQQMIAFSTYYSGDLLEAIKLYKECAAAYEPELHRPLAWVYGDDVGTSNQAMLSMLQWQAGYPEQAFHHLEESLRLAQEVSQANSQAYALYFKAYQYLLHRKPDEALRGADQTIALCAEHGLPFWIATAKLVRGWAMVQQEQPDEGIEELCEGAAIYQGIGTEAALTILFCIVADAYLKAQKPEDGLQAVAQGLAIAEKNNERISVAELWRLKGELWLQTEGHQNEAESCFQQAIAIAQQQSAKSWELRAATSLARLWQRQGKTAEARQMLAEIYGWFTEGFDTADLKDAKDLLDELSTACAVPALNKRHTVGREKERAELLEGFAVAQAGRGSLLCVAGEPGIGKTTLVEDFLAELAAEQCTIARGRCSERLAGTEAYLPLLEALENLLAKKAPMLVGQVPNLPYNNIAPSAVGQVPNLPYNEKLKQLAPTWYAQVVPLSGDNEGAARLLAEVRAASQERMKRELASFLQAVAQSQPLVIFFDDLHWADVSTIDLLSFLAGKFDALNVLVVVTYRPSDMLLAKHPFLQIKPDLQARGVCRELLLEFLTEAEIAEYLALEFPGHRFPPEFPKLIHAKTEGSPLFMADLVRYLRDRGVIAEEESTRGACVPILAQALPDIERELPESVRGMIERKIAQLSEDDCKLLTAASVQGYEFDSAVIAQVLNLDADEVEERLEKLERVFAFVKLTNEAEFPNGTLTLKYRFVHVLYQNALYGSLRVTRKASLSATVAQSLTHFHNQQCAPIAAELANLYETARDWAKAVEFYLVAAQQAAHVVAHKEAVTLAQRGLQLLPSLPDTAERLQHELLLNVAFGFSLNFSKGLSAPETGTSLARAREICQQLGNPPQLFPVLFGLHGFYLVSAKHREALEIGQQLLRLAELEQDPVKFLGAHAALGWSFVYLGNPVASREHFEKMIAVYQPERTPEYLAVYRWDVSFHGRICLAKTLWLLGYPDQALQWMLETMRLVQQITEPQTKAFIPMFSSWISLLAGDSKAAQRYAETSMSECEQHGLTQERAWANAFRGGVFAQQGKPVEGAAEIKAGMTALETMHAEIAFAYLNGLLAEVLSQMGDVEQGIVVLAEGFAAMERNDEREFEAELHRVKGDLLVTKNCDSEAENAYQQAIAVARQQNTKSLELRASNSLARLWQQQGKNAEARHMLAKIYGWFTEGFDTADLKDAKALLDELQQQTTESVRYGTGSSSDLVPAEGQDLEAPSRYRSSFRTGESPSIAVLPFVNISNDPDNEYFCDGLAEELLNALSKIEALHVAARTSAFSFKGKETDIREIGQKLNVGAVLEGSVRKSGNRLRITAQLINIADGYHLWSERYDRQMEDIFDIQDEISLAIVEALKVKLLGDEKSAVSKRYTESTEAYQLYLKGRFHYCKYTEGGFKKALDCFEQALALEPDYALALTGKASVLGTLVYFGYLAPAVGLPQTMSVLTKTLALDDTLAESRYWMANAKLHFAWDWETAVCEFKRAIDLKPNFADARAKFANLLALLGRNEQAIAEAKQSKDLDPLSFITNLDVGWAYWLTGQYELMHSQSKKLLELEPGFHGGHNLAAVLHWTKKEYAQAIAAYQRTIALGNHPMHIAELGCLYGITGEHEKAQQTLDQLRALPADRPVSPYLYALVYAGLGEEEQAFEYLEQAFDTREGHAPFVKFLAPHIPVFRNHPRLADLLRRIGLPE